MFFARLDYDLRFSSENMSTNEAQSYLTALKDGQYEIYVRYDGDVDVVDYIALRKDEFKGSDMLASAMGIGVDLFGKISEKYMNESRRISMAQACLISYLDHMEESMDEIGLRNAYGEAYDRIMMLGRLSPEKRKEMSKVRKSFTELMDEIAKDDEGEAETKYKTLSDQCGYPLDVMVRFEDAASNVNGKDNLYLSLGIKGRYGSFDVPSNKVVEVQRALERGLAFDYRKAHYLISYDEFTPIGQKILRSFFTYCEAVDGRDSYYYYRKEIKLGKEHIFDFFWNAKGGSIYFDYGDEKIDIDADEKFGSIGINLEGNLEMEPASDGDMKILASQGRRRMMLDSKNGRISFYEFESSKMARLYDYFKENGADSFEYIRDIFAKKALPVIGTGLIKNSQNQLETEGRTSKFQINLYIDLDDDDVLVTKTTYKYDGNEVEQQDIPQNPLYDACLGAYLKTLKDMNLKQDGKETDLALVYSFLRTDLSQIKKVAKIFLSDRLAKLKIKSNAKIHLSIRQGVGWLNASMDSEDFTNEELIEMLHAYKKKKKFFIMRDNIIVLDEQIGKASQIMDELGMDDSMTADRIPFFEAFKLKDMDEESLSVDLTDNLIDAIRSIVDYKNEKLDLDESIDCKLRDYQRDGIKWMHALFRNHLDGILADDMGLGKTLETIAFISTLKSDKPILIVCPTSVVYNWSKEFSMWNPSQKCVTIEGDKEFRKSKIETMRIDQKIVYVTSYDSLRSDQELYLPKEFSLMVIDEAQYIKNAEAMRSKSVKKIKADGRFALTGTPIENRLSDLWSIFDFLMHGYLGSYESFREYYELPISQGEKDKQSELLTRITPFILRRTKQAVLDSLPPKTTSVIYVNMNEKERKLYVANLQKARDMLSSSGEVGISFLAALTKLRQICVDAGSFLEGFDEESSKFAVCKNMLDEAVAGGHRVLVFSFFASCLPKLKESLKKEYGIDSAIIDGQTKSATRVELATKFNNGEGPDVMLVSLKAGGTGLNLIGADIVIHIDPWWNFAAEEQATDRAYRIGQTKPVSVYKLVCNDSIEERVIELQESKRELYDAIIKNGDEGISRLTEDDFRFIVS